MTKYQNQFMPRQNAECDLIECNLFFTWLVHISAVHNAGLSFQAHQGYFNCDFSKRLVTYLEQVVTHKILNSSQV